MARISGGGQNFHLIALSYNLNFGEHKKIQEKIAKKSEKGLTKEIFCANMSITKVGERRKKPNTRFSAKTSSILIFFLVNK